jgi:hypothetical protein
MNDAPPVIQSTKKRPITLFRALMIWVVLLGGLLLIVPVTFIWASVTIIYRADEGFKRAQRTINPEELRSWAFQEIKKRGRSNNPDIPRSEIPNYIRNLYPGGPESAVAISGRDGQQPRVVIFWGGGFFHWVMDVGDTNYSKPYVNENLDYRYNFKWTNGIYYSRETRWGLW